MSIDFASDYQSNVTVRQGAWGAGAGAHMPQDANAGGLFGGRFR